MVRPHALLPLLLALYPLLSTTAAIPGEQESEADVAGAPCASRSVAVLIIANPFVHHKIKDAMQTNARRLIDDNPQLCVQVFIDSGPIEPDDSDIRPLSRTSRLRNRMLDSLNVSQWDYVMWIDADVVEYLPDLPTLLIQANPDGVTAPLVLIEEPGPDGPDQFYDTTAFTLKGKSHLMPDNAEPWVEGRSVNKFPPYVPGAKGDLIDVDGVGTVYVVPARLFLDPSVRYSDDERLTEHWSVVSKAHEAGMPVKMHKRVKVRHANLPKYGDSWHKNSHGK